MSAVSAWERREMQKKSKILRSASIGRKSTEAGPSTSKEKHTNRRKTISFGAIYGSRCVSCKSEVQSPKMMKCCHVFCLQCFSNRLIISHKQEGGSTCPICNIAVINDEANKKSAVSFAPLPTKIRDEKCRICGETCATKCKHCKRRFCDDCWTNHVNDLKDEIANISEDLEASATKFEDEMNNFRDKANKTKEFINRDVEAKIAALEKKRQDRLTRVESIIVASETPVNDIKQRMRKTQAELKEQQEVTYDLLPDNEEKVKTFLDLQQKAAEVIAAISIWEFELSDIERGLRKINVRAKSSDKESVGFLYKRRTFTPKIIMNYNTVQRPSALAIDCWRDNVIVTCPGSGQIVIFDRKFKVVRRIRHQEMMAPQGIAFVQEQDEIYVTDKWKHCIFVFDHKGELVRRMCSKGYGESELRSPEGITLHPERNVLYIADTGNNRVQVLERDGTYLDCIGPKNKHANGTVRSCKSGPSQLNQPTDVAVTTTRVVVADSGNHKVKIFDQDGQLLQTIGGIGTAKGLFRSPEVLKIDKKGNIIVGDAGNGRVQIFSQDGKFLRVLGAKRTQVHKFGWVSGLLVMNNYSILVSDSKSNLIYLF